MKAWGGIVLAVSFLVLVRCSGPKVIAFTGNNPDFASYYTYRVKHPVNPDQPNDAGQEMFKKIEEEMGFQMAARGYEGVEVADIVITYNLILDNKVEYRIDRTPGYPYSRRYYNSPYGSYPYYWFDRSEYTEGTLLVELREELSNRLIWQASLDMKYNRRSSSKRKMDPVENAFKTIFSEYPYIAGNSKPQIAENQ